MRHSILSHGYIVNHLQLLGGGIQTRKHLSVFEVLLVVFHKHFSSLLVQGTFGEGYNEEAFDDFKDVEEGPVGGVPVFLEGIDANLSLLADVWVEYFGDEVALGRVVREIIFNSQLASEDSSFIGGTEGSLNFSLHISYIGFIEDDFGAYLDRGGLTIWGFFLAFLYLLSQHHYYLRVHLPSILLFFIISV